MNSCGLLCRAMAPPIALMDLTPEEKAPLWPSRFEENGLDGLSNRPGRGRKAVADAGESQQSVHAIWKNNHLKPHRVPSFKISTGPRFEELIEAIEAYLAARNASLR